MKSTQNRMKIVDIALAGPHNDGAGYQGNLLPKWQKKNGNDVTIITSCMTTNKNNAKFSFVEPKTYINEDGIKVIRLKNKWPSILSRALKSYKGLYETLVKEKPDFLFIHGCQFIDATTVYKYLSSHPDVVAVVDNHADKTNSALSFPSKMLHKTLWKHMAQLLNKVVSCFYGVLPSRETFLHEMYNIPNNKIRLLIMGADDDLVNLLKKEINEDNKTNELKIVCGGKFDEFKKGVLNLMKAVKGKDNVKLTIYGSIGDAIKNDFDSYLDKNINYVGWLNQKEIYETILKNDIAIFPGRHSVLWEQCVALGIPIIVKKLPETNHVDIGGNCIFLEDSSEEEIEKIINMLTSDPEKLLDMKKNANKKEKENFLYSNIARKSIDFSRKFD